MKKNTIKRLFMASLTACGLLAVFGGVKSMHVTAESHTVYVSSTGKDYNIGTVESLPYRTLNRALEMVSDGGTIVVKDSLDVNYWSAHGKTVTITEGELYTSSSLQIYDNVTFENVRLSINSGEKIFANGYTVVMGDAVTLTTPVDVYGGGAEGSTVYGTDLTIRSGLYRCVYGGSLGGIVDGDTHLTVTDNANAGLNAFDHNGGKFFFGGGNGDTITGDTYLSFGGNAKSTHLFGGSAEGGKIGGKTNLIVTGGSSMSMYGAGQSTDTQCDVNVRVTGGEFEQIFGGSENASLTGDVDLRVLGGTIKRRIYGGCYNETSGLSFASKYSVNGTIDLTIGSDASITYDYDGNDLSVYAHSRHKTNSINEIANLIFADEVVYDKYNSGALKLKVQDSTMSLFIGSLSVADETHYYTYSVSGNIITQTCAYHTDYSATATVNVNANALQYTGEAVEPISISYDTNWEYDGLSISYENNVEVGTATYMVSAENILQTDTFEIKKAPVILGGSVRLSAPAGLRFQSKVEKIFVEEGATFGTLVIPKAVLGENVLTIETETVRNIPQNKWATESVKENNPQDYEDGYAYFNAVLTDIPEVHFDKVMVARSYMYLNGIYYYSDPVERSIAKVASYAIQDGYTENVLFDYVDTALKDATVSMESKLDMKEGKTYQFNLMGNKDCVAIWSSSDTAIATVNHDGQLVAWKAGTVTVTAKIGNTVLECVVIVSQDWTGWY